MSVQEVASSRPAAAGAASLGMRMETSTAALVTQRVTQLHWQYGESAATRVTAHLRGILCHICSGDVKDSGLSGQTQG